MSGNLQGAGLSYHYGHETPRSAHWVSPKWVAAGGAESSSWKYWPVTSDIWLEAASIASPHLRSIGARSSAEKRASLISNEPGR
jgi:hypothetical protein